MRHYILAIEYCAYMAVLALVVDYFIQQAVQALMWKGKVKSCITDQQKKSPPFLRVKLLMFGKSD